LFAWLFSSFTLFVADKINTVLQAARIKFVEPYLPTLFANALRGKNIKDLLMSAGSAASVAAPAAAAPTEAAPAAGSKAPAKGAAEEKKKEEEKKPESEESDEDMGFDLFG
jgi:ribosomal protein L12E/L44/L45/RPP1/RPP2